ncbi:MAG: hypothetical protein SGARI_006027 [Bacillariaceae sp.]
MRKDAVGSDIAAKESGRGDGAKKEAVKGDHVHHSILKAALGEEGLAVKICNILDSLDRLDALDWVEEATADTSDDVATKICSYLEKFPDEGFCEAAIAKLCQLIKWNEYNSSAEERETSRENSARIAKQVYQSDSHNLVLQKMAEYPANAAIQQTACSLLYHGLAGNLQVTGEVRVWYGDREQNSLLRFLVSAGTVGQMATHV